MIINIEDYLKKRKSKRKLNLIKYILYHSFFYYFICRFINFSAITVGSPQCYFKYDFVDVLMTQTLAPIIFLSCLGLIFLAHRQYCKMKNEPMSRATYGKYITIFLLVTYLVLPGTTTTIFKSFYCLDVDPQKTVPGLPKYLRQDLSIACDSARYRYGRDWAIAMIFVYPIGILTFYFIILYGNRKNIKKTHLSAEEEEIFIEQLL